MNTTMKAALEVGCPYCPAERGEPCQSYAYPYGDCDPHEHRIIASKTHQRMLDESAEYRIWWNRVT